jgi:hypothetical protein
MVDVIEVLTLAAGVITALGVFAGPYLAEHLRAGRLSRRGHYEKIKEECLTPLSSTVAGLLASYFAPYESVGASRRYPFHSHEVRDTLVTLRRRAGVDLAVVNFFVGHNIDRYGYNQSPWDDPEHLAEQYSKLSRYLNMVSGREELLKEQYDRTLQEQLKARDKEIEDIKRQQAVILDAIAKGAKVDPRLLGLKAANIPLQPR